MEYWLETCPSKNSKSGDFGGSAQARDRSNRRGTTMAIEIEKKNWTRFFKELSKKRFAWETRILVVTDTNGMQVLSKGLYLDGVTFEDKSGMDEIEISVSRNKDAHQTHTILRPKQVIFASENRYHDSKIEIEEEDGTRTILRIFNPMPIMVGDAAYHPIATQGSESRK